MKNVQFGHTFGHIEWHIGFEIFYLPQGFDGWVKYYYD